MPRLTLPQHNATLTAVASGGTSEDYDTPASGDTPDWQGEADAWFHDRRTLSTNTGGVAGSGEADLVRRTYLVVPAELAEVIEVGKSLTFRADRDGLERTLDVRDLEGPFDMPGVPFPTARVWLRPE